MIRIWKLGNLENRITPTKEAVAKLKSILEAHNESGESVMDLIWGPDIEVEIVPDNQEELKDIIVEVELPPYTIEDEVKDKPKNGGNCCGGGCHV